MGFMSFVCLCVATAAAPSDPDQKKKDTRLQSGIQTRLGRVYAAAGCVRGRGPTPLLQLQCN